MPEYHYLTDKIFTVSEFFTPDECAACIALAEGQGFEAAPITTSSGPLMRPDVRNNARVMLDDRPRADALFPRIVDYIPLRLDDWTACGLNERFRFYRYDVGQQFEWHYDGCFRRENGERSWLTFMVYLNGGFEGGETSFEGGLSVTPAEGLALCFVHHIRHKGQPVIQGRKYVLRTDVMYQLGR